MARLKLTVAYVGAEFSGWQIQECRAAPRPRTIQGELEKIVAGIVGRPVRVHGAGRTDAGVHADAQTAHMDVPESCGRVDWMRAFAALLPQNISVMAVEEAADGFHARFDAVGKEYRYALWLDRRAVPPRLKPFVWPTGPLDVSAMLEAAAHLRGERDFASFRNAGAAPGGTIRDLRSIRCELLSSKQLVWIFEANGFLKQMARNLTGLLVYAGRGVISPQAVPGFLAARRRAALPSPTAPACGLTLTRVIY